MQSPKIAQFGRRKKHKHACHACRFLHPCRSSSYMVVDTVEGIEKMEKWALINRVKFVKAIGENQESCFDNNWFGHSPVTLRKLHFNLKACPHIPHLSSSVQLCAIVQQRLCWASFRRRMHSRRPAVIIPHMLLQHTQVGDRFLLLVGKTVAVATGQADASHHKTIL